MQSVLKVNLATGVRLVNKGQKAALATLDLLEHKVFKVLEAWLGELDHKENLVRKENAESPDPTERPVKLDPKVCKDCLARWDFKEIKV